MSLIAGTSRYRSSGSLLGTVPTYRTRYFPISCSDRTISAYTAFGVSSAQFGTKKSVWDIVTRDYFKVRAQKGFLPFNPYSVTETTVTSSGYTHLRDTTVAPSCTPSLNNWSEYDGVLMPLHFSSILGGYSPQEVLSDGRSSDLTTQVITQCMAARRAGKANYVESLAELDKSYSMLVNPLENVNRFVNKFRRSPSYRELQRLRKKYPEKRYRFKGMASFARREINLMLVLASSEYLRFRYGISPLMSDVKAGMAALEKGWNRPAVYHAARANGQLQGYVVKTFAVPDTYWTWNFARVNTDTVSIRASWWDSYRRNPFDELGLTFHNVVGVPWELTRLSFVVDWFVNVGDLIYANIPRVNLTPMGGTFTVKQDIWNSGYFTGYTNVDQTVVVRSGSYADRVDIHVKRIGRNVIDERYQRGGLVIKSDFRLDQYTRAADAIALVIQQVQSLTF